MSIVMDTAGPLMKVSRRQVISATTVSILGWALDLFDLFVLLYVAPVIGQLFFPTSNPTLSLAAAYASFSVTLLMRPIGAGVFGSYADRFGRKRAMTTAVVGVGILTALIGALPTMHQVGMIAPIVFIVLRLAQGIFVGGVVASTHTIVTESASPKYRGLMAGLVGGGGAGIGSLFASVVYLIVASIFRGPEFSIWGWRVMFFSGILSTILGFFIFRSIEESPFFVAMRQQTSNTEATVAPTPVRTLFTKHFRVFLVNLMIVVGSGGAYYLTSGFLPTFLKVINKVSPSVSSPILMSASVVLILTCVGFGYLSDVIGRKKAFLLIGVLDVIGIPLFFHLLTHATSISAITFDTLVLVALGNAAYAPVPIFLNERFPTALRSTGTALSWNTGLAIGGMMPTFVSAFSGKVVNIPATLIYFVIALLVLYLIGSIIVPETKGQFR